MCCAHYALRSNNRRLISKLQLGGRVGEIFPDRFMQLLCYHLTFYSLAMVKVLLNGLQFLINAVLLNGAVKL